MKSEELYPNVVFSKRVKQSADILVVGGTGFIGRTLVVKLQQQSRKVRVLCRSVESVTNLPQEVGLAFGNVKNIDSFNVALKGISEVYYCAAAMAGDWAEFYESTVVGTNNLLESLKSSKLAY